MGFLDKIIDNLPIELHLPGYRFCGPGSKLQMRLKRGDQPKNQLDAFCLQHDLAYANKNEEQGNKNQEQANKKRADADLVLEKQASLLARTKGTSLRERSEARFVQLAMAAKRKLRGGEKKEKT